MQWPEWGNTVGLLAVPDLRTQPQNLLLVVFLLFAKLQLERCTAVFEFVALLHEHQHVLLRPFLPRAVAGPASREADAAVLRSLAGGAGALVHGARKAGADRHGRESGERPRGRRGGGRVCAVLLLRRDDADLLCTLVLIALLHPLQLRHQPGIVPNNFFEGGSMLHLHPPNPLQLLDLLLSLEVLFRQAGNLLYQRCLVGAPVGCTRMGSTHPGLPG